VAAHSTEEESVLDTSISASTPGYDSKEEIPCGSVRRDNVLRDQGVTHTPVINSHFWRVARSSGHRHHCEP